MIVWGGLVIENEDGLDFIEEFSKDYVFNERNEKSRKIFLELLRETFEADRKLQEKVSRVMSEDYICFTIIPFREIDDLDSFDFELISEKDEKIPKDMKRGLEIYVGHIFLLLKHIFRGL